MDTNAIYDLSYGMSIVGSTDGDKANGMICNVVFQVTCEPYKVAACVHKDNYSHGLIQKIKGFSVSILGESTPLPFIGLFGYKSGKDFDKLQGVNHRIGMTGCPIIHDHTISFIEVKVEKTVDVGTHTLFIGEVIDAGKISNDKPMTYTHYHEVKGGRASKNAPTYRCY